MKFNYEALMDSIKRRIHAEDSKGRHVTEVLLTHAEWATFKSENEVLRGYHTYQLAVMPMPVVFNYEMCGPSVMNGSRQVTIRQE